MCQSTRLRPRTEPPLRSAARRRKIWLATGGQRRLVAAGDRGAQPVRAIGGRVEPLLRRSPRHSAAAPARGLAAPDRRPGAGGAGRRRRRAAPGLRLGERGGLDRARHGRGGEQDGERGEAEGPCHAALLRESAARARRFGSLFDETDGPARRARRAVRRAQAGRAAVAPSRNRRRPRRGRVQPDVVAVERHQAERRLSARNEAEHGQQRIDDRDAAGINDRAAGRARGGQAPQAEQDVDDVVQRFTGNMPSSMPMAGRPCSSRRPRAAATSCGTKPAMPTARKTMPKIIANVRVLIPALPCPDVF